MIVEFNVSTLEIVVAVAGSDPDTFNAYDLVKPVGHSVQIIADDVDVLTNASSSLFKFLAVVAGPILTSVIRKNIIELTSSANPIDPSGIPTVTVQLKQPDGVTNLNQVQAVTMSVNFGTLQDATLTTDGFGTASTIYKAYKGTQAIITGTAPGFLSGSLSVDINVPTTLGAQNWLETFDIRNDAVGASKVDSGARVKKLSVPMHWFIEKPYIRAQWTSGLDDSVNSVIVDDNGHVFINGNLAGNATVKQLSVVDGTVLNTYDYSALGSNLSRYSDTMAYDGENLWVPANTKLAKLLASNLSLLANPTISAIGKTQSAVWDGYYIYVYNTNKVGGNDAIYAVDQTGGVIYIGHPGIGTDVTTDVSADRSANWWMSPNNQGTFIAHGALGGLFGWQGTNPTPDALALDAKSIWVGGTAGLERVDLSNAGAYRGPLNSNNTDVSTIGQIWDLCYTGDPDAVWAITTLDGASTEARFLRRFVQSGSTIVIDQQIDLTTAVNPNGMAFDGSHLYIGSFGASPNNFVTKVFIGK